MHRGATETSQISGQCTIEILLDTSTSFINCPTNSNGIVIGIHRFVSSCSIGSNYYSKGIQDSSIPEHMYGFAITCIDVNDDLPIERVRCATMKNFVTIFNQNVLKHVTIQHCFVPVILCIPRLIVSEK